MAGTLRLIRSAMTLTWVAFWVLVKVLKLVALRLSWIRSGCIDFRWRHSGFTPHICAGWNFGDVLLKTDSCERGDDPLLQLAPPGGN
jgi:hypothetical protein